MVPIASLNRSTENYHKEFKEYLERGLTLTGKTLPLEPVLIGDNERIGQYALLASLEAATYLPQENPMDFLQDCAFVLIGLTKFAILKGYSVSKGTPGSSKKLKLESFRRGLLNSAIPFIREKDCPVKQEEHFKSILAYIEQSMPCDLQPFYPEFSDV